MLPAKDSHKPKHQTEYDAEQYHADDREVERHTGPLHHNVSRKSEEPPMLGEHQGENAEHHQNEANADQAFSKLVHAEKFIRGDRLDTALAFARHITRRVQRPMGQRNSSTIGNSSCLRTK